MALVPTYIALCLAAATAGALNAIAGGGTLLTFPVLLTAIPAVAANGTSTVALVPGSAAGAWGYRRELHASRRWLQLLIGPCLLGGIVGTRLVTRLPERYFDLLVPWLILLATVLFMIQPVVARVIGQGNGSTGTSGLAIVGVSLFQFLVAVYGGYFGAGIGILMLSALGLLGIHDIHQMNGLKTVLAACINLMSAAIFIIDGAVWWRYAVPMAAASIAGGYFGARGARRLNRTLVRWVVIAIGLGLSGYFFIYGVSTPAPPSTPADIS